MAKRSLKEFQDGQRENGAAAPLHVVEGGSTEPDETTEEQEQPTPPVSPDEETRSEESANDLATNEDADVEERLWSEYCQRAGCRHSPDQHIEGECQVLGCDCVAFVYPQDVEDSGQHRLPGEEFVRTEAERELHPLIRNLNRVRTVRLQANKDETDAQDAVLKIMKARDLEHIIVDGKTWYRVPGKEKVKTSDKSDDAVLPLDDD